jgi:hypothetical protein
MKKRTKRIYFLSTAVIFCVLMFFVYVRNSPARLYGKIQLGMAKSEVEKILWCYDSRERDCDRYWDTLLNQEVEIYDLVDKPDAGFLENEVRKGYNKYKLNRAIDTAIDDALNQDYAAKFDNEMIFLGLSDYPGCESREYNIFLDSEPILLAFRDSRVVFKSYDVDSLYNEATLAEIVGVTDEL